ncbi:MAG: DUF1392 family protein [Nostoc sp. DedQUE01]
MADSTDNSLCIPAIGKNAIEYEVRKVFMTEQITDLERCWFLSPPWGENIPPVEVNLLDLSENFKARLFKALRQNFDICVKT